MRELLSNNSLFVGQLYEDKSLALRARDLIFFTTDLSELLLNNSLLELIYFLNECSNLKEAQNRLNMVSFSERVFLQKAKVMYKVLNNIAPEYLTDLFKMRESTVTLSEI